jgi:hypothetical protein
LATFPQAMSSTTLTAAMRTQRISPTLPMTSSASGRTFGRNSNLANIGGNSEISRATSALAWASVTSGFSGASA